MVVLEAAPLLTDDDPEEGTPEHLAAKAALHRYWAGFEVAAEDYLVLNEMAVPDEPRTSVRF